MFKRLKRTLLSSALVVASALTIPVVTAPAAHAGDCSFWILCGQITNSSRNHVNIQVSNAWHVYPGSTAYVLPADKLVLRPGQRSKDFPNWKDVDAYWFPGPCRINTTPIAPSLPHYIYGNVWRKIDDTVSMTVYLEGC